MNNSFQYPLQISHKLKTLCKLTSLNMGGPLSDPIRCANQNNERKDPGRGLCPEGDRDRKVKEPFKSKCDSGTCWAYFMAYGFI